MPATPVTPAWLENLWPGLKEHPELAELKAPSAAELDEMRRRDSAAAAREIAREDREESERQYARRRARLLREGIIDARWYFGSKDLAQGPDNETAYDLAKTFAARPQAGELPKLLLICGAAGSGKSVLKSCVATQWFTHSSAEIICECTCSEIANVSLQRNHRESDADKWQRWVKSSLLIIDNLASDGRDSLNSFEIQSCGQLLREHHRAGGCLVVTMTADADALGEQLRARLGNFVYQSLLEYNVDVIKLIGLSYRTDLD